MGRILLVDDEPAQHTLFIELVGQQKHEVIGAFGLAEAKRLLATTEYDALVVDLILGEDNGWTVLEEARITDPNLPVIIMTAHADMRTARRAMAVGALDVFPKTWDIPADVEQLRCAIDKAIEATHVRKGFEARASGIRFYGQVAEKLLGTSPNMKHLQSQIESLKDSQLTVLISGPTGVGKDVVARTLHTTGVRGSQPFVVVDVPRLEPHLIESELFGHERGAYTGAETTRQGAFERADRGTLFLDEIGELPFELQAKLLRTVDTNVISRVGGERLIHLDVRIIVATNRDLEAMTRAGAFREDLYHRLAGMCINVPPLNQRVEDIPIFVEYLLQASCRRNGRHTALVFCDDAIQALLEYDWPGNVRELQQFIERLVVTHEESVVTRSTVLRELPKPRSPSLRDDLFGMSLDEAIDAFTRDYVQHAIASTYGNISQAAKLADASKTRFHRLVHKYGLIAGRAKLTSPRDDRTASRRKRILLIDDHQGLRKTLGRQLNRDYDVTLASDGQEALEILQRDPDFDIILCDLAMPKMDGIELYTRIQKETAELAGRFVFLTAMGEGEPIHSRAKTTAVPLLQKPLQLEQLRDCFAGMHASAQ